MSVYREVLQRKIREPAEKALLAEKILGRIAQNKIPAANLKYDDEKAPAAANKGINIYDISTSEFKPR
jgi:hypothetical protein